MGVVGVSEDSLKEGGIFLEGKQSLHQLQKWGVRILNLDSGPFYIPQDSEEIWVVTIYKDINLCVFIPYHKISILPS